MRSFLSTLFPDGLTPSRTDAAVLGMVAALAFPASANALTALGAITAGTGFTRLPTLAATGGTLTSGGAAAKARATSLKVISATSTGGTGYVTNDTVTFANGVVLTVTAAAGVPTSWAVTTPGAFTPTAANPGAAAPTAGVSQVSTSGVGTGAVLALVWGLGAAVIEDAGSYTAAPSFTATSVDGAGTGASIAAGTLGGNGATVWKKAVVSSQELPAAGTFGVLPSIAGTNAAVNNLTATVLKGALDGFSIGVTPGAAATVPAGVTVDALLFA